MGRINLNDRLGGSGNTDTIVTYALEVGSGGTKFKTGTVPIVNTTLTTDTTGDQTMTAAQMAGGLITGAPGAAQTYTTDTAAAIISGLSLTNDGDMAAFYLINLAAGAFAITVAGGTTVTMANAGQTLAQNESALILLRRTSATAVTCYVVGA